MNKTLTALEGDKVGHSTHTDKLTGCTVVLFDDLYPVAYKSYGGAPGTFGTENLRSGKSYSARNGLFISGGSLLGLQSASEIMDFMIENGLGIRDGKTIRPAISGAIVYDLGIQVAQYDKVYGRQAAKNATRKPVEGGNVGAGTGTSVGKLSRTEDGLMLAMKAGVGSFRIDLGDGATVCALSVVNAVGNVVLPDGAVLAGNRNDVSSPKFRSFEGLSSFLTGNSSNTTISIVGTNVDLGEYTNYETVAHIASQGHVRAINPVNTSLDGDTVFVFSTQKVKSFLTALCDDASKGWGNLEVDIIGQASARAVQESIYAACRDANSIPFAQAYRRIIPSADNY